MKVGVSHVGLHILSVLSPLLEANPGNQKVYNVYYDNTVNFFQLTHHVFPGEIVCL